MVGEAIEGRMLVGILSIMLLIGGASPPDPQACSPGEEDIEMPSIDLFVGEIEQTRLPDNDEEIDIHQNRKTQIYLICELSTATNNPT